MNKIIRSVCYFSKNPTEEIVEKLKNIAEMIIKSDFKIQTTRICSPLDDPRELKSKIKDPSILLSTGLITFSNILGKLPQFYEAGNVSFYADLTAVKIDASHTIPLFEIIKNKPSLTFCFTYVFNNRNSSPYFPSASYQQDGFSIGLQPTDLAQGCHSLDEWLERMKESWMNLNNLCKRYNDFLGIDSSIAPIFSGHTSLVNFIKSLGKSFSQSVTTDFYLRITEFIKQNNPKPVGLCGLMLPCLEDFELAEEYEVGNFTIERNIFLSLHSGLGIDTYPIGIDEEPERVVEILRLVQALSDKYKKPLSVRLVSDGKATIGDKTDFKNQYLKDVLIRPL